MAAACGSSNSSDGFSGSGGNASPTAPGGGTSSGAGGGFASDDASAALLPPEPKVEDAYKAPVATGNIVWIANPVSGRVAYIDAKTFAVQTVAAGNQPTYLAAVPSSTGDDVALVQNVLSHDATLMRVHMGQLTATTYPSTPDANSWAISPKGRWAIAWTDAQFVTNPDPAQGFQDVEVIDLSGARAPIALNVGYRPSQLAFSGDETHAYAVTEDGISVLDLAGGNAPSAVALYPLTTPSSPDAGSLPDGAANDGPTEGSLGDAPAGDAAQTDAAPGDAAQGDARAPTVDAGPGAPPNVTSAPDVSFTPDGAYALVRIEGYAQITVISMKDGSATAVGLPSAPTDLTMSPTGAFALAVMRDIATVAVLRLPGIVGAPGSFTTVAVPGEIIGRAIVTQDGKSALLFTGAAPIPRMTVLTLASATYRTITLHAPILAVFPTNDGTNAVVLHQMTPVTNSSVQGAFSIVPVSIDLPAKIVGLPAPPTAVALAPTSDYALVSVRSDPNGPYGLYVGKMPSLEVVPYTLASPPSAVGIAAAAHRGYVAQDYPDGRITFVDLGSTPTCDASASCNSSRTITGFELGARVVNGSTP